MDSQIHYVQFEKINSFKYITIFLDELISEDPKKIIDYINAMKINQGIDYIKVRFRVPIPGYNKTIINNYYRNNGTTFVEFLSNEDIEREKREKQIEENTQYSYLLDKSISDFERFVRFVNESEGHEFITVTQLSELLQEI